MQKGQIFFGQYHTKKGYCEGGKVLIKKEMTSTLFKAFPLRKRASKPSSTSAYGKKTILVRNFFITMNFSSHVTKAASKLEGPK